MKHTSSNCTPSLILKVNYESMAGFKVTTFLAVHAMLAGLWQRTSSSPDSLKLWSNCQTVSNCGDLTEGSSAGKTEGSPAGKYPWKRKWQASDQKLQRSRGQSWAELIRSCHRKILRDSETKKGIQCSVSILTGSLKEVQVLAELTMAFFFFFTTVGL